MSRGRPGTLASGLHDLEAVRTRRLDTPTSAANTLHVVEVQDAIIRSAAKASTSRHASGWSMFCTVVNVTGIPVCAEAPTIRYYDITGLDHVCVDGPANGFSLIIIPAFSGTHSLYARKAPGFEDMFIKPLVGWVAGCHLDD